MESLSKEERGLLYRLVSNGAQATLAELDDEYLELDVLAKHELALNFAGLAQKGLILGSGHSEDDWYVDMWGMLNLRAPELTRAGREFFVKEQQMSCVEFYGPGGEPVASAGEGAPSGAAAVAGAATPRRTATAAKAEAVARAATLGKTATPSGATASGKTTTPVKTATPGRAVTPATAPKKPETPMPPAVVSLQELRESLPETAWDELEELNELLIELEEIIDNLEQTKYVTKNSGFVRRLEKYRDKRAWFHNSVLALLGQAVLDISCGRKQPYND